MQLRGVLDYEGRVPEADWAIARYGAFTEYSSLYMMYVCYFMYVVIGCIQC